MSNTATMLRKTEAELDAALAEVKRLRKANAELIRLLAAARVGQLRAYTDGFCPCRGCGKPSSTVYCGQCADGVECEHGHAVGECTPCDVAGDFAFDAMREDARGGRR